MYSDGVAEAAWQRKTREKRKLLNTGEKRGSGRGHGKPTTKRGAGAGEADTPGGTCGENGGGSGGRGKTGEDWGSMDVASKGGHLEKKGATRGGMMGGQEHQNKKRLVACPRLVESNGAQGERRGSGRNHNTQHRKRGKERRTCIADRYHGKAQCTHTSTFRGSERTLTVTGAGTPATAQTDNNTGSSLNGKNNKTGEYGNSKKSRRTDLFCFVHSQRV